MTANVENRFKLDLGLHLFVQSFAIHHSNLDKPYWFATTQGWGEYKLYMIFYKTLNCEWNFTDEQVESKIKCSPEQFWTFSIAESDSFLWFSSFKQFI